MHMAARVGARRSSLDTRDSAGTSTILGTISEAHSRKASVTETQRQLEIVGAAPGSGGGRGIMPLGDARIAATMPEVVDGSDTEDEDDGHRYQDDEDEGDPFMPFGDLS
jgi:hypothetical protein